MALPPLPPPPPPPLPKPPPKRRGPPQDVIDEFWKEFSAQTPSKATTVIPQNEYAEKAAKRTGQGPERTTQSSYAEAAEICRTKVRKIADECRAINRKYRDPHFDLEYDLKCSKRDCLESLSNKRPASAPKIDDDGSDTESDGPDNNPPPFKPRAVKRVADIFDEPQFFIDGPSMQDVRQGNGGDCWFLAALCTLSNKKGLIERVCVARDEQVGVYGFVFHRDGEWFSEIIDDKLYLKKPDYDESFIERMLWDDRERVDSEEAYRHIYQSNSGALYFSQCENPNETWLPLLEKCYAKAHGDYASIEGGFTGEGIEDLTGGVTTEIYTSDILDREAFWKDELMQVNKEFLFGCSTGIWGRGLGNRKGIVELHAYSVMRAVEIEGKRLVLLKNPWGKGEWKGPWSDGSKEWTAEWLKRLDHQFGDDGAFWISYSDLLRKYQAFDRTRLFGDDWRVASMWTPLSIPWKHDYHDTRFEFTLSTGGEVVIVLSQLDDRYFRGLEGQYTFSLSFRLHRAGQEDYIVRTSPAYRMSRSVNVEVKLEAGDYTVMVKVDAVRNNSILPVEDVIRNNAKTRREKLLRIGLAYDLAHSKGRYKETEEEKALREAHEKRVLNRKKEKMREFLTKEKMQIKYVRWKKQARDRKEIKKARARNDRYGDQEWDGRPGSPGPRRRPGFRSQMDRPSPGGRFVPRGPGPRYRDRKPILKDAKDGDAGRTNSSESRTQHTPSSPSTSARPGGVEDKSTQTLLDQKKAETADKTTEDSKPKPEPPTKLGEKKAGDEIKPLVPEASEEAKPKEEDKEEKDKEDAEPPTDKKAKDDEPASSKEKEKDASSEKPKSKEENELPKNDASARPRISERRHVRRASSSAEQTDLDPPSSTRVEDGSADRHRGRRPLHRVPFPPSGMARFAMPRDGMAPPPLYREPEAYCESDSEGSDSEVSSISSVSDVTDREVDMELGLIREPQNPGNGLSPPGNLPPPPMMPLPPGAGDKPDIETDPWNAVVVVGLRIYHKIPEEDKEKEVVKLRVVRPNPYSDDEASSADDKGEKKKDKSGKKKRDKSKGLDVDDSAKDATLEGTEKERKMSIVPTKAAARDDRRRVWSSRRVMTYRPVPQFYETE